MTKMTTVHIVIIIIIIIKNNDDTPDHHRQELCIGTLYCRDRSPSLVLRGQVCAREAAGQVPRVPGGASRRKLRAGAAGGRTGSRGGTGDEAQGKPPDEGGEEVRA